MALGFGFRKDAQVLDIFIKRLSDEKNVPVEDDFSYLCSYLVFGTNSRTFHTGIGFKGLPRGRWAFKFEPCASLTRDLEDIDGTLLTSAADRIDNTFYIEPKDYENNTYAGGYLTFKLSIAKYGTDIFVEGELQRLQPEIFEGIESGYLSTNLNSKNWRDVERNTENTDPFILTSVNEIVDVGNEVNYDGVALLEVELKASERLTNPPSLSVEIEQGQVVPRHLGWGIVEAISNGSITLNPSQVLEYPDKDTDIFSAEFIRNIRSGNSWGGMMASKDVFSLEESSDLKVGDEVVIYKFGATCLFPDIFCDLLLNREYGFGSDFEPDLINFKSIIESNDHCLRYDYFWDGRVENATKFTTWATKQAASCLLYPVRIDGSYGLAPENPELPLKAVFNDSNILKGSFNFSTLPRDERNINKIIIVYTDGKSPTKELISVTVQTKDSFFASSDQGYEKITPLKEVRKRYPTITNREQAIDVAVIALNSSIFQNEQVSFETDYQGLGLSPADIVAVQQKVSLFQYNGSGLVTEVIDASTLRIDTELTLGVVGYKAYLKGYETGEVTRLTVTGVDPNNSTIEYSVDSDFPALTPQEGDPVLIYDQELSNKRYRVQDINLTEEGVTVQAVNWTKDLFKGTQLLGFNEETLDSAHVIRDDFYVISIE